MLDDYHEIKNGSCHDQVAFLLHHLPPSAQIVLITRADPPLPLGRLRAGGEMVEIRQRELRFTPADTAALVHAVAGIQLTEPDLADLVARTEGWPTGVYLAVLSLRGHPSPGAFVRRFAGENRFAVDFLAEEVLSRQPGEIQQFLMRTSILDRFCAPLCDAVTGSAGAADIIAILDRENLFLVPLDDNRQWYRYHHLFAQLLRSQLARTEPGVAAALHERASAWHRGRGRSRRRSVTPSRRMTSPGPSTSSRVTGTPTPMPAGRRRSADCCARLAMTGLPPARLRRTARPGSRLCPATRNLCSLATGGRGRPPRRAAA